jgi:hypothetical protein
MNRFIKNALYWTPRLLTIAFILFLAIFALDVFVEGRGVWETFGALLIHLIPNFLLLAILLIAWKWEWLGAFFFTLFGLWYLIVTWGQANLAVYFLIIIPVCIIALLFLADWIYNQNCSKINQASKINS